jgi:hypothetical protein
VLGLLSVFWLAGYVVYWCTWDYFIGAVGALASLIGIPGALCWLLGAALLRSKRMLVVGAAMGCLSMIVLSGTGNVIKAHAVLSYKQGSFLSTIDEIKVQPEKWLENDALAVTIDIVDNEPIVAFDLGGGFLDDYPKILYDPRGLIRQSTAGKRAEDLPFDANYGSVWHLRGPWYYMYMYPDVPLLD